MEINIAKDYGNTNISSKRHVDDFKNWLKNKGLGNDNTITLDLSDCITDYPSTPNLIDIFLIHLSKIKGNKKLKILYNGLGNRELYILLDIILEGEYFGIHDKINNNNLMKTKKIINEKLIQDRIEMEIVYTPDNKTYFYGNTNRL